MYFVIFMLFSEQFIVNSSFTLRFFWLNFVESLHSGTENPFECPYFVFLTFLSMSCGICVHSIVLYKDFSWD